MFTTRVAALLSAFLLCAGTAPSAITYGTLDNFDVINDTGGECHGFEIELEGITSADVVYTFGAPYQRYGDPTLVPTATGVIIRYAGSYSGGVWTATTPFTAPPYLPTQGHSCWTGGVADPQQYYQCGCDHFGASLNAVPTKTTYRWLVENPAAPGTLMAYGSNASLPAPVWNVTPQPPPDPQSPPPPPIVQAAIVPPPPDQYEFGDALWVKVYTTELPEGLNADDLDHMVVDDPDIDIVPNEPAEVEMEWVLMQASTENEGEQLFGGEAGAGAEAVSRRFEFYKYVGEYNAETHEALCDDPVGTCPEAVGDLIGTQNVAVNLGGPINIANQAPTANAGTDQAVYVTNIVTLDGSGSTDPEGSPLTYAWNFTSMPSGSSAALSDATAVNPTFAVDKAGTYTLELVVNDGALSSVADSVDITTLNSPPVAAAGADQQVKFKDTVLLDGSGSYDVDEDVLTYSWTMTAKPAHSKAALSGATTVSPSFKADKPGTYTVELTVNDGKVSSAADSVDITATKK